jgi:hypothetical protein
MFQTPRFSVPRAACCPCGAVALADKPPVAHSLTGADFARQSSLGFGRHGYMLAKEHSEIDFGPRTQPGDQFLGVMTL